MDKETIVIILLIYKDSQLIPPLLKTINEDYIEAKIVLLDNGSTEASYKSLSEIDDPRVTLISTSKNLGYTGGINHAVEYAIKNIPDFKSFFIINPDAASTPNLVYNLSRLLNSDENVACVSPKILSMDDRIVTYSGGKINLKTGAVKHIVFTGDNYPQESYEVDAYHGGAVLFDVNKFVKAGMLNDDLFIYYDEAYSSLKVRENKWKVLYAPALEVYHDTSFTMRKVSYLKTYYMARNKLIVFNKSMGLFNKLYFTVHGIAYHLKYGRVKNAVYHLKGVYDFIKGKKGIITN
jgi:GT2 family glycosyltransferase